MKKYSQEYWLRYFEYVMGHKPKLDIDTSNATWTRGDLTKVLNGQAPYGWTGTNGAKALVQYIEIYHSKKLKEVVKLMLGYIEGIQTEDKPCIKIHNFYSTTLKELK